MENHDGRASTISFWRTAPPDLPEDKISDPGEIILFARSDADCQAFLVSQMCLNDELAQALRALERRQTLKLRQLNRAGYEALSE